ncbi:hypothetical protein Q0Z83_045160 [Actinoplanes sichuanensis]|uniref:Uncharacterized protein n=1 Tax=Actinoplanes sichuanensis TaxID=512349 RepID=A0ABW4A0U0_9ACTN|nr:hypothetical protein [Actinoplanes sichuanensis]BEL06325.1 hypothetical protein Q0Z83_045160 [Actinoplanes sichuanensis]
MPSPLTIRRVRFDVRPWGDDADPARELHPFVDNVSLVELVAGYERSSGFDVPGAYAGLVLDHFNFGDLTAYLMGEPEAAYWTQRGTIALLGCDCGEVGCRPFESRVLVEKDLVIWRGFTQPFRPQRDYGSFGPFTFRRNQYDSAVREAAAVVSERADT